MFIKTQTCSSVRKNSENVCQLIFGVWVRLRLDGHKRVRQWQKKIVKSSLAQLRCLWVRSSRPDRHVCQDANVFVSYKKFWKLLPTYFRCLWVCSRLDGHVRQDANVLLSYKKILKIRSSCCWVFLSAFTSCWTCSYVCEDAIMVVNTLKIRNSFIVIL
jgi:hypothetical protein